MLNDTKPGRSLYTRCWSAGISPRLTGRILQLQRIDSAARNNHNDNRNKLNKLARARDLGLTGTVRPLNSTSFATVCWLSDDAVKKDPVLPQKTVIISCRMFGHFWSLVGKNPCIWREMNAGRQYVYVMAVKLHYGFEPSFSHSTLKRAYKISFCVCKILTIFDFSVRLRRSFVFVLDLFLWHWPLAYAFF